MFLLVDNYDSFTYNLWHFLGELGAEVVVHRNDKITVDAIEAMAPEGIVISPGPCDPDQAGICLELVNRLSGKIPILGVCLGHQTIGQVFGGVIERGPVPMHGKTSMVSHDGRGVFEGLPERFEATRYHSLVVRRDSLPNVLSITAESDDGMVMGVQHAEHATYGVQFHPESIASENGHRLLANFMRLSGHTPRLMRPVQELEAALARTGT